MINISACIITFNEEKFVDRCLKYINKNVDEIILVDSNSSDRTVEIARKYTDKIYFRKFTDYSDQINYCASLARNDWVMVVDADEIFDSFLWNSVYHLEDKCFEKHDAFCFPRKVFGDYYDEQVLCNKKLYETSYALSLFDVEKDFWFKPIHYPVFLDRLYKCKKCQWIGFVHQRLVGYEKRKFIPAHIYHLPDHHRRITKKNIQYNELKRKNTKINYKSNEKKLQKIKTKLFNPWFYFKAMFWDLKFYKKGPKYLYFIFKWFVMYFNNFFKS